jgi:hypothetical protein
MGAQTISDAVARALLRLKTTKVNYHPALPFLSALFASPRVPSLTFNYNTDTFEPLIHVPRTPPCARTKMKVHAQNLFKKAASSALVIPPALQPNQINDAGIAPTTCARFRKAHRTLGPPAAFLSHPSPAVLSSPPSRPVTKTITHRGPLYGIPPKMIVPSPSRTSSNSAASPRASFYLAHFEALGAPNL